MWDTPLQPKEMSAQAIPNCLSEQFFVVSLFYSHI